MPTPFNLKLRRLREDAGLTQEQLAQIVGASTPAISGWENDQPRPRLRKHIDALCDYFGISEDDLFGFGSVPGSDGASFGLPLVGSSESAFMPFLGHAHAGEFEDPLTIEGAVVEVPKSVADNHPRGRVIIVDGDCVNRVITSGSLAVVDPDVEPRDGSIVCASIDGGDFILRKLFRGAKMLMLSPDSHSDEFEDIVFAEGDERELDLVGTVVWHQAAREME